MHSISDIGMTGSRQPLAVDRQQLVAPTFSITSTRVDSPDEDERVRRLAEPRGRRRRTTHRTEESTYTMPLRETVAGEATERSSTSKSSETCDGIAMRSPLISVSSLLSSSTVFIDSIHSVSTGPSSSSHFSSLGPSSP